MNANRTTPRMAGVLRPAVQVVGFLRKEVIEILHQPRLLLVLVAGPFVLLLAFAVGYDTRQTVMRTAFVGPPESIYEESLDQYADQLRFYVTNAGYGTDLLAARDRLAEGDVDLVVVFPDEPADAILSGQQAEIIVLHDKLDPIQQTAVEIAAEVAVLQMNATVLEGVVAEVQSTIDSYDEGLDSAEAVLDALDRAVAAGEDREVRRLAAQLVDDAAAMAAAAAAAEVLVARLATDSSGEQRRDLDRISSALEDIERLARDSAEGTRTLDRADIADLREALDDVRDAQDVVTALDPVVLVRPFTSDAASLVRERVGADDYLAPAAIALLLQHMVLTFAALTLVKDRACGLFEIYRVGPLGAGRILAGKFVAYLLVGALVGAALITAVTLGLGVPHRGDTTWIVVGVAGLLAASISAGLLLSLVAQTDTQAVQFSMLVLLAGLFFGGFLLDLDAFDYPVRAIAWAMPVTYGVRILRDVMLRGDGANPADLLGLLATTAVFATTAWLMLGRRLRVR